MGLCASLGVLGAWWGAALLPSLPASPTSLANPSNAKGGGVVTAAPSGVRRAPALPAGASQGTGSTAPKPLPRIPAVHRKSHTSSRLPFQPRVQSPFGGTNASLTVVVNGTPLPPRTVSSQRVLLPFGISNLKLFVPETQTNELFLLGVPSNPSGPNAPLLVGFHQFGVSHADMLYNTEFFEEAMARGWYVCTPLSANSVVDPTRSFASLEGQVNSRAALEWVCANYPIDMDRIYGVGFSAGGGMALSMAARYQDPSEPMFAAVVGHTGTIDMADSYALASAPDKMFFDALYGGSPSTQGFEYRRTSTIHLDNNHVWLPGGDHMAVNLSHLNCLVWYDTADPLISLVQQNSQLFDWSSVAGIPGFALQTVTMGGHSWDTLDEVQTCDWLAQFSRQAPLSGELLMDRDARFQHFLLAQDSPGAFSRVTFDIQVGTQTVSLLDSRNVQSLSWSPTAMGLSLAPGQVLQVLTSALDAPDTLVLEAVPQVPVAVRRDGVATSAWTYSASTDELELLESDPALHTWTISF